MKLGTQHPCSACVLKLSSYTDHLEQGHPLALFDTLSVIRLPDVRSEKKVTAALGGVVCNERKG